jgi:hypothetical protein
MEESGGILSLSVTVGGQEACEGGAVEERARHSGMDEGDGAKKGVIAVVDAFYGCSVARAERKTGRGSGVRRHVEGKMGKRERAPGAARDSSAPDIGHATGEGGEARATRTRAADKRDQATSGPGGRRLGAGGSERERGSDGSGVGALIGGPGSTVPPSSVLNRFK